MISERRLTPAILEGLKKVTDGGNISYTINYTESEEDFERKQLAKKINNIKTKEERIKEAYRDGIDTLEEYKANKEILATEKKTLVELLERYTENKTSDENKHSIISSIKSAYDIISSSKTTDTQKHEALCSVVEKIVYDKKNNTLSIYFYLNN